MTEFLAANAPLLRSISVLTLLGYSVHVALRSGVFSFATVGFYAVSGYLTANLLEDGLHRYLVLLAVLVATAVVAVLVTPVLTRLRYLYLAMATLALTLFVQSLAQSWPTYTGGAQGLFGIPRVLLQGEMFTLVIGVVVLVWLTQRSAAGRSIAALRHDEVLSASVGVDVRATQARAFVASAVIAGTAGFVQTSSFGVFGPTDISFGVVVSSLTVLVVGGALHWVGPLLGGVLVAALPIYLSAAGSWNLILQAVVVLVVVVYRPDGLAGLFSWASRRVRRRKPPAAATSPAPSPATTEEVTR
ncbi:branched-chain amino acid ABC transporter permease [Geodermatophilaceae bacterium NBWT11]|nr:branched-chain amino acid ABC transporter permease [Geodermatophilaceae bacterium NBWT11]